MKRSDAGIRTREELLGDLMDMTIEHLTNVVKAGEARPSDIANILKLLKDNNITTEVKEGSPLDILSREIPDELPFN